MNVESEDVTVTWGHQPHPLDIQYSRWRLAVFQDVQESIDGTKLYFLYDPDADERSMTSGARKGGASIVVFDLNLRCFTAEMPLSVYGKPKFLFALKAPSMAGGTSFVLVTETQERGMYQLHVSHVDLWAQGNAVADNRMLLRAPLILGGEYICTMREDVPELVVMANPGLQVWRIDAMVNSPADPAHHFSVQGAELRHFYDGFVSMGAVYLLSSFTDGNLDYSRVHVLSLNTEHITTHTCMADPMRGMPPARKQAACDAVSGYILLAGGEVEYGGQVTRLSDYWVLDLKTFQWTQIPSSMPIPLIEPRLTTTYSGNVYLWGDFDQPLPSMPTGTHLRILRVKGFGEKIPPPSYDQSMNFPSPLHSTISTPPLPYPQEDPPYPSGSHHSHPYPSYHLPSPQPPGWTPSEGGYDTPTQDYSTTEKRKKKKDCSIQ